MQEGQFEKELSLPWLPFVRLLPRLPISWPASDYWAVCKDIMKLFCRESILSSPGKSPQV